MSRPFSGATRIVFQVILIVVGIGLLAVPPLVIALSGVGLSDALWVALRVAALEALTLIGINICVGAFRSVLVRGFNGLTIHRAHVVTDLTGFAVGLAHGLMAFVFGTAGYTTAAVWTGPAVLLVLVAIIITALTRRRLRRSWRWIHRFNYLIFGAVLAHSLILGYDLRNEVCLKVWLGILGAAVVAGLAYRVIGLVAAGGRRTRD